MAITRSFALDVVWQFAADEAVNAGSDFIDPEHFLIGVCSIEKLFSADRDTTKMTSYSLSSIRAEWQDVLAIMLDAKLTPSAVRRSLRKRLPQGQATPGQPRTVNRSERSRAMFTRAEQTAKSVKSNLVGVVYLLNALLEDAVVASLVRAECRAFADFQSSVALYAKRPLQAYPAVAQKASTSASMMGESKGDWKAAGG
jgi:hypothetical protein